MPLVGSVSLISDQSQPIAPLVAAKQYQVTQQLLLPSAAAVAEAHCYLVDPASSHMLVSKIKPCMSKYKQFVL